VRERERRGERSPARKHGLWTTTDREVGGETERQREEEGRRIEFES
jgi:hypothetical protein